VASLVCTSIVGLSISRGIKLQSKIVIATSSLLVVVLLILLGESIKLDRASGFKNVAHTFKADWSKLRNIKIWRDAFSQVIFISGIGFGPVAYTSNCMTKDDKIKYSFVTLVISSLVSILATSIMFVYIGPKLKTGKEMNGESGYEVPFAILQTLVLELDFNKYLSSSLETIFMLVITLAGINVLSLTFCMMVNFLVS
jgi:SNF family Na+-dependent transporter